MFISEIISYPELVAREKANLQKGMNFGIRPGYSIILMSVRRVPLPASGELSAG